MVTKCDKVTMTKKKLLLQKPFKKQKLSNQTMQVSF
uniref:Uncharacterized protein n=1 Tax=Anguilla anguilla TaxID=7936 RepID=A0A0E9UPW1_ANGAN